MGTLGTPFGDQVVVVTGAGSGIGRASAAGFSRDGATVVGIGRSADSLANTTERCSGNMTYVCADLSKPDECSRAIEQILASHHQIDVLVNNAGTAATGSFLDVPVDGWLDVIALNLGGVAACTRAVLPHMIQRERGRIITLTSRMAARPVPQNSAYSVSKAAVSALTRALAAEITEKHPDVLINDLIPGPTRTKMNPSGQDPDAVYPFLRQLALLEPGGPSGQVFFNGRPYQLFVEPQQ